MRSFVIRLAISLGIIQVVANASSYEVEINIQMSELNLRHKDIARMLDVAEDTVSKNIRGERISLRQRIEKLLNELQGKNL